MTTCPVCHTRPATHVCTDPTDASGPAGHVRCGPCTASTCAGFAPIDNPGYDDARDPRASWPHPPITPPLGRPTP